MIPAQGHSSPVVGSISEASHSPRPGLGIAMKPAAFALARPTSLTDFHKARGLAGTHPVRRRPRVVCKSAGYFNPDLPKNATEFAQRALRLARSIGTSNSLASQVEEELRRLGSVCAADLAFAELRGDVTSVPRTWREVLQILGDAGIVGESLDRFIDRLGLVRMLSIDVDQAMRVLELLNQLKIAPGKLRRLLVRTPALLEDALPVESGVQFLRGIHLKDRDIANIFVKWPAMLALDAANAQAIMALLRDRVLRGNARRFILRAPFVLLYRVEEIVKPALGWMEAHFADVEQVVRGCPLVLGNSVSQFQAVKSFLVLDVGIPQRQFATTVRAFPPILVADEATALRPALRFLRVDLGFSRPDTAHIAIGFPATLVLDVDAEMRTNIEYFRGKGIENVNRLVRRLPPILSYDLRKDIIPKMFYLENSLRLSPFDVLSFPAYFSYPLESRIQPRTLFLRTVGKPLSEIGLNMALSLGDEEFCRRVAERPLADYQQFCARLNELRDEKKRLRDKEITQKRNAAAEVEVKMGETEGARGAEEKTGWAALFSKH